MRGELAISARKHGAAVRAFVGLPLAAPLQTPVTSLIETLRKRPDGDAVRWVNPEGLHLTLRFLGNVPTERVPELAEALRERLADVEPFAIKLGGPEPFPAPRRPRVVVLGCSPVDPVAELAARMEGLAVELGFPPERRTFKAHLTLGRLRSRRMPGPRASGAVHAGSFGVGGRSRGALQERAGPRRCALSAARDVPPGACPRVGSGSFTPEFQ